MSPKIPTETLPAECPVAATVRAAEAVRRGQWLRASSTAVFGIEEGNVDGVDLDDFCFPEAREEMNPRIRKKLAGSEGLLL
jgi:hypothetical protein